MFLQSGRTACNFAQLCNPLKLSHLQFKLHQRADEDDPGGLLSSNPVPSSGAAGVAGGGGTSTSSSTSAIERARFSSSSSSVDSSEASNRAVSEGETNPPSTVLDSSKTLKTRDVMKQGTCVHRSVNGDFFRTLSQDFTKLVRLFFDDLCFDKQNSIILF